MIAALFRSSTISEDQQYSKISFGLSNRAPLFHSCYSMFLSQNIRASDLTAFNTLGLACHAARVLDLSDVRQLPELTNSLRSEERVLPLGGGSNVILPAQLSSLVVRVQLKGITLVEARADAWVIDAAAGECWHDFVATCVAQGWDGLENLALIPGTVGAAPVQNIGAYGVELDAFIESVTAWNIPQAQMVTLSAQQCGFKYRDSLFKHAGLGQWLIVNVRFCIPRPWQPRVKYPDLMRHPVLLDRSATSLTAKEIFDAVCDIRRAKLPDPAVLGNAGSFFKNPVVSAEQFDDLQKRFAQIVSYPQLNGSFKLAAGWLIERCGWKGRRVGHVGVHDRQSLVLVNYGQATAHELLELAAHIQESVFAQFGVALEIEPVSVPEN